MRAAPRSSAGSPTGWGPAKPADGEYDPLPSYEEVIADKRAFAAMTRICPPGDQPVQCPAAGAVSWPRGGGGQPAGQLPLTEEEMDRVYGLPYTRRPHPSYGEQKIPAFEVVKDSIQIMRGCFGGCTFCSITAHEGRVIQSRSRESVLAEIRRLARRSRSSRA